MLVPRRDNSGRVMEKYCMKGTSCKIWRFYDK